MLTDTAAYDLFIDHDTADTGPLGLPSTLLYVYSRVSHGRKHMSFSRLSGEVPLLPWREQYLQYVPAEISCQDDMQYKALLLDVSIVQPHSLRS